jgi:2-succinyl-5-enolpyruvyl-6-hydroxy-3-cyclohexene-1-carboxylate synthase
MSSKKIWRHQFSESKRAEPEIPVTTADRPVPAPERSGKQTGRPVHQPEIFGARPYWPKLLPETHREIYLCVKIFKTCQKHAQCLYKATIRKVKTMK